MTVDVFKEIKDLEEKSEKAIEDAEKIKQEIIQKARHDSLKLITEKDEAIEEEKKKVLEEKKKKIDASNEKIVSKGRDQADQLRGKAEKNKAKAVSFILKRVEDYIKDGNS